MKAETEAAGATTAARMWASVAALAAAFTLVTATGARALSISPLDGTPDANPATQISFLGVPVSQIGAVSVIGSSTGPHAGSLAAYASAPGASFRPTRPFAQGERVTASALVGPRGHARRVASTFYVARLAAYSISGPSRPAPARAGTVQRFVSEPSLHPPNVAVTVNSATPSPGDIFLTPTHGLGQSGPMIIDGRGRLVWYRPVPTGQVATDLQVEQYRGAPVLVWWQGNLPARLGVGFGTGEIYSTSYAPVATVSAGNGYAADLHDLQLTPHGSALITAYTLVDADLSSVGGSRAGILQDSVIQEVDVATGLVMFEWHAYGHVELADSYATIPRNPGQPWDFFHLNSISADPWGDGNFIASSRNTWAGYEINHTSGRIMWRIGGRASSFKMGAGTGTAWQHDVRWQADHTLTMFDNGAVPKAHSQSRIIRERIDWRHRKVKLLARAVRTPALLSGSQGNDELLPGGGSFVGWGEDPFFTEFSPTGQIVFDAHLPLPGQSYRAFRFPWSATPAAPPALAVRAKPGATTIYASWNGATNVASWRVLAGATPSTLTAIATVPVAGFETTVPVGGAGPVFAVQALDASGAVIGTSPARR